METPHTPAATPHDRWKRRRAQELAAVQRVTTLRMLTIVPLAALYGLASPLLAMGAEAFGPAALPIILLVCAPGALVGAAFIGIGDVGVALFATTLAWAAAATALVRWRHRVHVRRDVRPLQPASWEADDSHS